MQLSFLNISVACLIVFLSAFTNFNNILVSSAVNEIMIFKFIQNYKTFNKLQNTFQFLFIVVA